MICTKYKIFPPGKKKLSILYYFRTNMYFYDKQIKQCTLSLERFKIIRLYLHVQLQCTSKNTKKVEKL